MRAGGRALVVAAGAGLIGMLAWRVNSGVETAPSAVAVASPPAEPRNEVAPSSSRSASVAVVPAAQLDAEAVLRRLEPLAVHDKPRALQLALEADSTLPTSGVLAEARRALIVTLLVDVDRMPEARARARQFRSEYPSSGYLPLVEGVTGVHPRPRPSEMRDVGGLRAGRGGAAE
jgi:hypothetical protein